MALEPWQRIGRWAAGSLIAAANQVQQGFHAGLEGCARILRDATNSGELPGRSGLSTWADDAAHEAARRRGDARRRRDRAGELARGGDGDAAGWSESAAETAAETLVAPFADIAGFLLRLGSEGVVGEAARAAVRRAESEGQSFRSVERGEAYVAVAREAGVEVLTQTFQLASAALRAGGGETEPLRRAMEDALAQMRLLAAEGELGDLLPETPFDAPLQRRARRVVERAPKRFLDALGSDDGTPVTVLRAAFDDADDLGVYLVVYPQALSLVAAKVGRLMLAGELNVRQLRSFLQGRKSAARGRRAGTAQGNAT